MKIKTTFIVCILFYIYGIVSAQVTTYGDSSPNAFEFLPYNGSRIIQGFRVDMGGRKYCIIYSKPEKGVSPDTVFVQQFIKNGLAWDLVFNESRSSLNTLFIWGNRGGFFTDDAKNGIAYTAFSEESLATGTKHVVGYFILYKGKLFTLSENNTGEQIKSSNYADLPLSAQQQIAEAFAKLDKWN